jgi:hypothetical protein
VKGSGLRRLADDKIRLVATGADRCTRAWCELFRAKTCVGKNVGLLKIQYYDIVLIEYKEDSLSASPVFLM